MVIYRYSCGPYAKFKNLTGKNLWHDTITSTCNWNKTWSPNPIPQCFRKYENIHNIDFEDVNIIIGNITVHKFYILIIFIFFIASHCKSIVDPPEYTGLRYKPFYLTSHLILQSGRTLLLVGNLYLRLNCLLDKKYVCYSDTQSLYLNF